MAKWRCEAENEQVCEEEEVNPNMTDFVNASFAVDGFFGNYSNCNDGQREIVDTILINLHDQIDRKHPVPAAPRLAPFCPAGLDVQGVKHTGLDSAVEETFPKKIAVPAAPRLAPSCPAGSDVQGVKHTALDSSDEESFRYFISGVAGTGSNSSFFLY